MKAEVLMASGLLVACGGVGLFIVGQFIEVITEVNINEFIMLIPIVTGLMLALLGFSCGRVSEKIEPVSLKKREVKE